MINEYQVRVLPHIAFSEYNLKEWVAREYSIDVRTITAIKILRRSIDARQRVVVVNLKLQVYVNETPQDTILLKPKYRDVADSKKVIVVGEGPAGLAAALRLIELGLCPIVLERGKDVRERKKDLAKISKLQKIDDNSNYCYGEGGAGAYSDGKLYTRSKKRGSIERILNIFCLHGAPASILIDAHPHIGTDKLPRVIENMRNRIVSCGGKVYHQTKMTRLVIENNTVIGVEADDLKNGGQLLFKGPVILATGHSARDVYKELINSNVDLEPKGIAVGVRLEHPSELIDKIQYHNKNGRGKYLPAAEYSFVTQVDGRGVYSFCMCPGGYVIPAATGPGQIVVNGMSPSSRNGKWSNSGMVVEVRPEDIDGVNPLKMLEWQEKIERKCWEQGNMTQKAPAQRMVDFVNGKQSYSLPDSSYSPGLTSSSLDIWLPHFISDRLKAGFINFGKSSKGFLTNEATMIAVETRTSSPVRLLRNSDNLMHVKIKGLFPCGEGAGYAGGIVSAAIDGERCAEMCHLYTQECL